MDRMQLERVADISRSHCQRMLTDKRAMAYLAKVTLPSPGSRVTLNCAMGLQAL